EFSLILIVTTPSITLGYTIFYRIVYPESFTQRVLFLYLRSIPDYLVQQTKSGVTFLTNLFAGKNNKTP
ncbi:hypothetical protein J0N65_02605, partial [Listeria monocytogenes]|nr:hypothetical protein [Listeria monocytogenes]